MKEFMEGCSIPDKSSSTTDIRYGCTSVWGDPHTVEECSTCNLPDKIKNKCKCYSNFELKEIQNCSESVKNSRILGDQFCAYEDDDGFLVGCGPGCCDADGCPGECCKSALKSPDANRPASTSPSTNNSNNANSSSTTSPIVKPNTVNFIIFVLVLLLITSALLLLAQ